MIDENELILLAAEIGRLLQKNGDQVTTAESCTGGWIAQAITAIPGSSGWFEQGFVTYANSAKINLLGVAAQTLAEHGAVSEATVAAMAEGALERGRVRWALAVSGIAGPDGGGPHKPVGTVCFAWAKKENRQAENVITITETRFFHGDRRSIRAAAVYHALDRLRDLLENPPIS